VSPTRTTVLIGPPRSGSSLTPPFSARLNVEAAGVVMLLTAALFRPRR
jgi:hypothetical protein